MLEAGSGAAVSVCGVYCVLHMRWQEVFKWLSGGRNGWQCSMD